MTRAKAGLGPTKSGGDEVASFLDAIEGLRLDRAGGRPKPYKLVLLMAITILAARGQLRSSAVRLDQELTDTFHTLMNQLFPGDFSRRDPRFPFRHLERDGVWALVARPGVEVDLDVLRRRGGRAARVVELVDHARLPAAVYAALTTSAVFRSAVISTLCRTYDDVLPPNTALTTLELIAAGSMAESSDVPPSD